MATMSFSQSMQINTSGITFNPNSWWIMNINNNNNPNGDAIFSPIAGSTCFIGTSTKPFHAGYFNAVHYNGNLYNESDSTLKENTTDLESAIDKIKYVRTVRFDYKPTGTGIDSMDRKNKIGFLAQDIMKYFPEMVKKDGGNGKYSVNYIEMIPVLLKAVQDLKTIVDQQQVAIKELSAGK
jgi:hypothetical protein